MNLKVGDKVRTKKLNRPLKPGEFECCAIAPVLDACKECPMFKEELYEVVLVRSSPNSVVLKGPKISCNDDTNEALKFWLPMFLEKVTYKWIKVEGKV